MGRPVDNQTAMGPPGCRRSSCQAGLGEESHRQIRQAGVEWLERCNEFFEAIELDLAEHLIGMENVEGTAARGGAKPLLEKRRNVPHVVADRLSDFGPQRL